MSPRCRAENQPLAITKDSSQFPPALPVQVQCQIETIMFNYYLRHLYMHCINSIIQTERIYTYNQVLPSPRWSIRSRRCKFDVSFRSHVFQVYFTFEKQRIIIPHYKQEVYSIKQTKPIYDVIRLIYVRNKNSFVKNCFSLCVLKLQVFNSALLEDLYNFSSSFEKLNPRFDRF